MNRKIPILFLFLFAGTVFAQIIPQFQGHVTDSATILILEEKTGIENRLIQLEKETTAEIAILIIPSLEGNEIFTYTTSVFDSWKVGKEDKDNGLLLVIAIEEREYFIQTGYGLEGTIPDVIAGRVGREKLSPNFKNEEYSKGINEALDVLEGYIRNDETIVSEFEAQSDPLHGQELLGLGWGMGLVVLVLFIALSIKWGIESRKNKKPKETTSLMANTFFVLFTTIWAIIFIGFITLFLFGIFFGFTIAGLGLLYLFLFVKNPNIIKMKGGKGKDGFFGGGFYGGKRGGFGGTGGFGGFGGGMSGGGGAGGRW